MPATTLSAPSDIVRARVRTWAQSFAGTAVVVALDFLRRQLGIEFSMEASTTVTLGLAALIGPVMTAAIMAGVDRVKTRFPMAERLFVYKGTAAYFDV